MFSAFSIYLSLFWKKIKFALYNLKIKQKYISSPNRTYESFGHAKTRLRYHIIFSTKYRRKCLDEIHDIVIDAFRYTESKSRITIHNIELDKDHIHMLVSFPPAYSIEQTVRRLKQCSMNYIYHDSRAASHLRRFYWKNKRLLWTNGYFCSTIGNVSESKIKEYIENQG